MNVREFKDCQGRPSALIFDQDSPVDLANYWIVNFKPGLAPKSRVVLAYDLSLLMLHFKGKNLDIIKRFTSGKYLSVGEVVRLRNSLEECKRTVEMRVSGVGVIAPKMVCSSAFVRRCRVAREFLEAVAEDLTYSNCLDKSALQYFKLTLKKHLPSKQKNDSPLMVEPITESEFLEIDHALRSRMKSGKRARFLIHRDLIVFHLLRELGVRNSELLGITIDGFTRTAAGYMTVHIRRNKDLLVDPRSSPATVKTLERKLKISDNVWTLVERFIVERNKLPKARRHNFLIVTMSGAPLSNDTIGNLFGSIRQCLGRRVTPHTLRHSWASNFVIEAFKSASSLASREREIAIASALSILRAHMGWSLNSSMPEHYARYAFQMIGNERLLSEEQLLLACFTDRSEHEKS